MIYALALLYLLFIFYLAVMSLYRAKQANNITKTALILGYPILAVGAILDFLVNVLIGSIVFMELPKEFFLTMRLRRLKNTTGWKGKLANWICINLLNNFDPSGNHCK